HVGVRRTCGQEREDVSHPDSRAPHDRPTVHDGGVGFDAVEARHDVRIALDPEAEGVQTDQQSQLMPSATVVSGSAARTTAPKSSSTGNPSRAQYSKPPIISRTL